MVQAPLLAVGYAVAKAQTPASNTPARFRRDREKPVVVCLGGSMVRGSVSFNAVEALSARLGPDVQVVNAGVNGDLAWNARARLDEVIACEPDCVVVLVGSNDVVASLDRKHALRLCKLKRVPERPTLASYREHVRAIVSTLRAQTEAKIALCSLPPLGEALDSRANRRLAMYNAVLREVATNEQLAYVPLHEDLVEALRRSFANKLYDGSPWPQLGAMVEQYVLGRSLDRIGQRRGYVLLSDGVHLTSRAGTLLVERLEGVVRTALAR